MHTPREIYERYRIPPWLQMHQLRVAAVGKTIADRLEGADTAEVIVTALFHDMGNILKFDLSPTGPLAALIGSDVAYWQMVKDDFARMYGTDEHEATIAIAREIALSESVIELIEGISFSRMERIRDEGPLELQICEYADMRVGPFGVLPLSERLADLKKRSEPRWAHGHATDMEKKFDTSAVLLYEIENTLFGRALLKPDAITDASIAPIIELLWDYPVTTS